LHGSQPYDVEALVKTVEIFSGFVSRTSGLFSAVDINPLMVRLRDGGGVVADALMTWRKE
jgi:hypothetical protein